MICKKIVDSFGGTLEVKSQLNKGTRFSFEFKLASNFSFELGERVERLDSLDTVSIEEAV